MAVAACAAQDKAEIPSYIGASTEKKRAAQPPGLG